MITDITGFSVRATTVLWPDIETLMCVGIL